MMGTGTLTGLSRTQRGICLLPTHSLTPSPNSRSGKTTAQVNGSSRCRGLRIGVTFMSPSPAGRMCRGEGHMELDSDLAARGGCSGCWGRVGTGPSAALLSDPGQLLMGAGAWEIPPH